MPSHHYKALQRSIKELGKMYLNFSSRPAGNYTRRQLSSAAAYTVFCHAELETFFENWTAEIVERAAVKWATKVPTRALVHLCTFHIGRSNINNVPAKDIWNEPVILAIKQHQDLITANHGIKESNVCQLLTPIGFDVRNIDTVLLADLSAFAKLRGDYAHKSHTTALQSAFDPFSRRAKVNALVTSLLALDADLDTFAKS